MRARCKFSDNLLVTTMDAIKDANGQPDILQVNFRERTVMSHKRSNGFSDGSRYYMLYSDVKNTFFGCQAGLLSSPSTASMRATNSPWVLTPRTRLPSSVSSSAFTR